MLQQMSSSLLQLHDCLMDNVRVPVLQTNEVALDRIRFGAIRREESSAFYALPRDLAAYRFGDQFGK